MLNSLIDRFLVAIIVVGLLLPAVVYPVVRVSRARGIPRLPALLCAWAWIAVLGITVVPDSYNFQQMTGGGGASSTRRCFVDRTPLEIVAQPEAVLNMLLFVPLGLLTVLVLRRPLAAFATIFLASTAIEMAQLISYTGRQCDVLDLYSNSAGTAVGVGVGCVLLVGLKWRPLAVSKDEAWWSVSALALGLTFFTLFFAFA
ncbi:VanZ family protein [Streptomyces sp. NPDC048384]|uniref:VanZ family protein n=1 Tax=Streptomyces sp. NPDC048384 TaxID=3155487 RepID=UPI0034396746